jgi:RNA polymerase sigma factor (sigma-70 family)
VATNPLTLVLEYLRRSALLGEGTEQTDGQLLEAFLRDRDALALETLVRRHAPMVWGVCRRTLASDHDAEDAFQATFVVLLRKAASLRSPELLANWLYRVAHKTACKTRQMATKRHARETQVAVMPEPSIEPPDDEFGPELRAQLHNELARLPEKYRIVILLCDLQGRSRSEVARQLGVPEGTVGSRVARGRTLLARRLARHGLKISAGGLAAGCAHQALSGSVPAALLTETIRASSLLAAGQTAAAGTIPAPVALLTEEVLRAMAAEKQKKAAILVVMATLVLTGGAIAYRALPDPREPEPPPPDNEEAELEKFGSEAGAIGCAKARVLSDAADYANRAAGLFIRELLRNSDRRWPARSFQAMLDPETHRWTVVGDVLWEQHGFHVEDRRALRGHMVHEMMEHQVKYVMSYDPSYQSYHVVSGDERGPSHPARTDDMGKWLQHDFQKPMPTATPVTSLRIVSGSSGEVLSSYTGNELQVETGSRGATIRANHDGAHPPAGGHAVPPLTLRFAAPFGRFLKVGEYGGAIPDDDWTTPDESATPNMSMKRKALGEFVVWECEVRDQRISRLAIDYITWDYLASSARESPVYRSPVSGSLRFNSLFQPAVAVPSPPDGVYRP